MGENLPIVGAALPIRLLESHHNWLLESQRDLEIQDFCDPQVIEGDWSDRAAEAKRWLDGYTGRMGIHGAFWDLPLHAYDPLIRDVVKRRLWQGLDVCEALGGTHMVVHSPYSTWDHNNLDNTPGARQEVVDLVHLSMGDAVRRAENIGVTIVIENIEDKDPLARVELAKSFNSRAVAVSIDTGHAYYAHASTGAPPVDYYVTAAGPLLAHIHLQDADGYADRHWTPGMGTLNWNALFAAIERNGSNPRLILELKDQTQVQDAAAWLAAKGLVR
ncbi:MAG TPA: sugar phosphate isomerase/epimerase [Devosia sp.]|nr:sugar phosphate isomerase/epimerase [Devosia sp.]